MTDLFLAWNAALEKRHLASLTFQEVRRSVQALSTIYVENRGRIDSGAVLNGAGKRAAFAMFYAPLHFLLVWQIARALKAAQKPVSTILDFGCGTGAASAAWALEFPAQPKINGFDVNAWAIQEAQWTYRILGLRAAVRCTDLRKIEIPNGSAIMAAFTMNEVDYESRASLLNKFISAARRGSPILIVEPIARRFTKWWDSWEKAFDHEGGRHDEWRFAVELPENLKLMDKAAGLDHREVTGRSLWLPGR